MGFLCFLGTLCEALQDCLTPDNLVPPKSLYSNQDYDREPQDSDEMQRSVNDGENKKDDFNYSRFGTDSQTVKMTRGWWLFCNDNFLYLYKLFLLEFLISVKCTFIFAVTITSNTRTELNLNI